MHLSRLKLVGFKSFHQETDITFDPGITAIVGPNGCGKSNICDAIRWVLGEQGYRSLRAERMEDVIFNGNGTHQPLGMAEVSLTLVAHEHQLPTEFSEIHIVRRFFRSGDSEYFLNGVPCLLRDILNLFLDSGLGNSPYALIEQGALASVIDSKPSERKFMIDEAAGIMKYKVRKKAAVTKLEAAEQNLLRLGDIISEVEQQRNSLSRQAKRAKEYEELRKRIEYLEGYLRIQDYHRAEGEAHKVDLHLQEKRKERSSLVVKIHQQESRIESERLQLVNLEGIQREIQESSYRLQGEVEKVSAQFEMLAQEERESAQMGDRTREELLSCAGQLERLEVELGAERGKGELLQETIDRLSQKREELRKQGDDFFSEMSRLGEFSEEKRREAIVAAANSSHMRNQQAALENQNRRLSQQAERLKLQQESHAAEMAEIGEKRLQAESRSKILSNREAEWKSQSREVEVALASAMKEDSDLLSFLTRVQGEVEEFSGRLRYCEDLQNSYLGYGEGAKFLLQSRNSPLHTGTQLFVALTELIEPNPGCEKAIEALLGSEVQGLVLAEVEEIRQLMREPEILKKGGAIFLPAFLPSSLDPSHSVIGPSDFLPPSPGIVGQALDEIRYEPSYEGLMRRLFSDCLIVQDIEVALEVFAKSVRPRSIATLKGEAITRQGAIRLPSASSSGLLVRKGEIKELNGKLQDAKREFSEIQARKEDSEEVLRGLRERSASLEKEEQTLKFERITLEKDQGQLQTDWERVRQIEGVIRLEMRNLEEEVAQSTTDLSAIEQERKEQEDRQGSCEEEVRKFQGSIETLKVQRKQILEEFSALEDQLHSLEEEQRKKEMQVARMEEQLSSLLQREGELREGLREIQERGVKAKASLEEKERVLSEVRVKGAETSASLREIEKQREEASKRVSTCEGDLNGLRQMISTVDSALGDLQIKKAQIDQTLHHMRQDLTASHFSDFAEVQASYERENMETSAAQEELTRHQDRCRKLEPVNMAALADYEALSKRFQFLNSQADDLRNSVSSLRQAISEINKTTQKLFGEAFRSIDQYFGEYCVRLFGGGSAQIRLQGSKETGEEEVGVELLVSPPGKHLGHLDLLSGGEKALTGLAFLMALFRYRPAPFCFLDEVDAPLDDANVGRYLSLLKEFSPHHQFIVITHNKKTMEAADGLYGVTMEQPGISKVVSVKLDGGKPPKSRRDPQGSSIGEKHGD